MPNLKIITPEKVDNNKVIKLKDYLYQAEISSKKALIKRRESRNDKI